jgi:serine/threonine-protein phosphatase 2B regulatory subunit
LNNNLSFTKMAENDTVQLQRAIFAQYIMMKRLFMELEVEREASATAASAAMSMIRKLQKEKDAERMEAWQYKRIAEEKINHTNRALDILKEVVELKQLEISYLRYQLQVCKQKLLDAGIDDCDVADETIDSDKSLFGRNNMENLCHKIKRNSSLPTLQLNKQCTDMDIKKNGGVPSARSRLTDDGCEQISIDVMALEPKESFATDLNFRGKHGEEAHSPRSGSESQTLDDPPCCSSFSVVSHQADICSDGAVQTREDKECTVNHDQLKDSCVHESETSDEPPCSSSLSVVSHQADICSDGEVPTREHNECAVNHDHLKDSCVHDDSETLDEPPCSSSFSVVSHQADICSDGEVPTREDNECAVNHDHLKDSCVRDSQTLDEPPCSSSFSAGADICSDGAVQARGDMECTVVNHVRLKDSCAGTEIGELVAHPLSEVDPLQTPKRSNKATDSSCTGSEITTVEEPQLSPRGVTKARGPRNLSRFAETRKVGSMNNVDRHVRRSSGTYSPRAAGVERTMSKLKRVQSEKMVELGDPRTGREQIIMLKEVYEQLRMIESHMRPSGSQESPRSATSLDSVMEVFLFKPKFMEILFFSH